MIELDHAVVDSPHDALGVPPVSGTAVHRQREVDGVALAAVHAIGPTRVDGGVLVEGVGVVAAPFSVGAHDVHEAGLGGIGPHVGVEPHRQDGEDPLVALEDCLLVERRVRTLENQPFEDAQLVDDLTEDGAGVLGGHPGLRGIDAVHAAAQ